MPHPHKEQGMEDVNRVFEFPQVDMDDSFCNIRNKVATGSSRIDGLEKG